ENLKRYPSPCRNIRHGPPESKIRSLASSSTRSPDSTSIRTSGGDGSTANRAAAGLSTRFRPGSRDATWIVNPPILRCTRLRTLTAAGSRVPATASAAGSAASGSLARAEHGFFRPERDLLDLRLEVRSFDAVLFVSHSVVSSGVSHGSRM